MSTKKKILFGAVVAFVLLLVVNWFFRLPFLPVPPEDAIPRHSAMVVFFKKDQLKQADSASFSSLLLPVAVQNDLAVFEQMFAKKIALPPDVQHTAVVQPSRATGTDVLFIAKGFRQLDLQVLLHSSAGFKVRTSIFKSQLVYTVQVGAQKFSLSKYRNLLLFARQPYFVEDAISQLNSPGSALSHDGDFKKLAKRKRDNETTIHLIISLEKLSSRFSPLIHPARLAAVAGLGSVGRWAHFQVDVKSKLPLLTGAFCIPEGTPVMGAARDAPALPFKNAFQSLPDNLTAYAWLAQDDFSPEKSGSLWRKFFEDWAGNEFVYALGEPLENEAMEQFILLKSKDGKQAEKCLVKLANQVGLLEKDYDYQLFKLRQIMGTDVSEMLGVAKLENPFVVVMGDFVLFSNSKTGVERWLDKYLAGQTFSKNVDFLQSIRPLPDAAQGFVFFESERTWQQLSTFLDPEILRSIGGNPLKFSHLAATLNKKSGLFELTIVAPQGQSAQLEKDKKPANILWRAPLAKPIALPPAVFRNPASGEMEVFVQDEDYLVYLISRSGRVLWRRKLDEPILSKVVQVDMENEDEGQFVFSTATKIYALDRSGSDLPDFPFQLQTPASNGVTVIDFFESKDYEFFIACENGLAYGFDEKGSPVEGWRPHENVGTVRHPLVHFQEGGKDYLILLDSAGVLKVFQKNGAARFPKVELGGFFNQGPDFQADKTGSRIVACDSSGSVSVVNLSGGSFKLSLRAGKNKNIRFAFADLAGDERRDYLALSGEHLALYNYEGSAFKKRFDYEFSKPQDEVFKVHWSGNRKDFAGTVNKNGRQIFLLDGDGKLLPQFPLAGTTTFVIADLLGDGKPVVVVGNGESVYAYLLD